LSKQLAKWILLANMIAWPVFYLLMSRWLNEFAYRIHIGLGIFVLSGFIALLLAVITVGCQATRAAVANPVDAIRYE
jgi:putative ABC transport system permease protein